MSSTRTVQPVAPAVLVAFSVAVCLGAAATLSAGPMVAGGEASRVTFRTHDREALASLLSCFTDAARRLHAVDRAAAMSPSVGGVAAVEPACVVRFSVAADHRLPASPLQAHLLNLPPPIA